MSDESDKVDYRLVCRTCMVSDAVFYKLDSLLISDNEEGTKTSYMDCLRYCTKLEEAPQLPIYICADCAIALRVAYNFIQNAVEAHAILCQKLCNSSLQRCNGKIIDSSVKENSSMRYRCKICSEKLETKKSLKEHLKLHLDIITYSCSLCDFEAKKRSQLSDHYKSEHNMEPSSDLLKARTCPSDSTQTVHTNSTEYEDSSIGNDDISMQMELIHNETDMNKGTAIEQFQHQLNRHESQSDVPSSTDPTVQLIEQHSSNFMKAGDIENQLITLDGQLQSPLQSSSVIGAFKLDLNIDEQLQDLQHHLSFPSVDGQEIVINSQESGITLAEMLTADGNNTMNASIAMSTTNSMDITDFNGDFNMNEMSIGNEFVVLEDGTVKEVVGNDVVIEYISATSEKGTHQNGLLFNNVLQLDGQNNGNNNQSTNENSAMDGLNLDDIIIDETGSTSVVEDQIMEMDMGSIEDEIPSTIIQEQLSVKEIKCKVCSSHFASQEKLKTHMLSHNEIPHFFCDHCPFYTFFKIDLTQHYKTKHMLHPTTKQLQPKNKIKTVVSAHNIYTCDMCLFETRLKTSLKRHYSLKHNVEATDIQLRPALVDNDVHLSNTRKRALKNVRPDYPHGLSCKKCQQIFYWRNKLKEHYRQHNIEENEQLRLLEVKINNNDTNKDLMATPRGIDTMSTAIQNIPNANAISIDTNNSINNIEFDLNGEVLFEDFEEEEENDDNDATKNSIENYLLTSDDDYDDAIKPEGNADCRKCVNCNKNFTSQYQFENHMFLHRGLAPYRCELCTNLYNTKRALIRHYKAVHKKIPTRDMIQAKGDKATDDTPIENLNLEQRTETTLMCAKCPYETNQINNINIHLEKVHGLKADAIYILKKLSFECPRCIRSFASRDRLIQHLERNHSRTTIAQQYSISQKQMISLDNNNSIPISNASSIIRNTTTSADSRNLQQQAQPTIAIRLSNSINKSRGILDVNERKSPSSVSLLGSTATSEEIAAEFLPSTSTSNNLKSNFIKNELAHSTMSMESVSSLTETQSDIITTTAANLLDTKCQIYSCRACDFTCDSINELDTHSRHEHYNEAVRDNFNFECHICNCKYKTIFLLKHHMKRHTERKFFCPYCPKGYITKSELRNHKALHFGMPHACDMCNKRFGYAHHLKRHKDIVHFGKRYICPEASCERKFTTQAQLKSHYLGHYGVLPYKCKICGRNFKKREYFRQHSTKMHQVVLTDEEIAEIYRNTVGFYNPHDFTIAALTSMERTTNQNKVQIDNVNKSITDAEVTSNVAEENTNFGLL